MHIRMRIRMHILLSWTLLPVDVGLPKSMEAYHKVSMEAYHEVIISDLFPTI